MSAPLIESLFSTGQTLYAIIHNPNGQVWLADTHAWESFNAAHWTNYALALTEQGSSGYYSVAYPSQITGVLTTEAIYTQRGGAAAQSDQPGVGIGQTTGVNVVSVFGDEQAASNMQAALATQVQGAAVSGTLSTTQMTTDLSSTVSNVYNGRLLFFLAGSSLAGNVANILAYNGLTKMLTFTGITAAPANTDAFIIV